MVENGTASGTAVLRHAYTEGSVNLALLGWPGAQRTGAVLVCIKQAGQLKELTGLVVVPVHTTGQALGGEVVTTQMWTPVIVEKGFQQPLVLLTTTCKYCDIAQPVAQAVHRGGRKLADKLKEIGLGLLIRPCTG